jgi:chorismate synthase
LSWSPGRVAAGAIAEKYLHDAYGIEIVAFVSSVGKIHVPSTPPSTSPQTSGPADDAEDADEAEDALSQEFRDLLHTITREQVDQHTTRCPHRDTAERMVKVKYSPAHRTRLSHIATDIHGNR